MSEPIEIALQTCGQLLTFDQCEIYGIPGFSTQVLYKGEVTVYEVERQNFVFEVSTLDCYENDITTDMTFTMEDSTYSYTFQVDRPPVADLTGWSRLYVNYVSRTAL